jgi:hypothetical protein
MLVEATIQVRQNNLDTVRTIRTENTHVPDTQRVYILGEEGQMIDTFLIEAAELLRLNEVLLKVTK